MDNDFYSQENHGPYERFGLGDFKLENGGQIPDAKLAFSTTGKLNAAKDNAVLLPHIYSDSSVFRLEQAHAGCSGWRRSGAQSTIRTVGGGSSSTGICQLNPSFESKF
ncbi:MAG: hypothetical protein KTR35_01005 [Gammaproteobacteria bacterium]|nr:hypothetical protein [Gammaproteobacteria bacterium]